MYTSESSVQRLRVALSCAQSTSPTSLSRTAQCSAAHAARPISNDSTPHHCLHTTSSSCWPSHTSRKGTRRNTPHRTHQQPGSRTRLTPLCCTARHCRVHAYRSQRTAVARGESEREAVLVTFSAPPPLSSSPSLPPRTSRAASHPLRLFSQVSVHLPAFLLAVFSRCASPLPTPSPPSPLARRSFLLLHSFPPSLFPSLSPSVLPSAAHSPTRPSSACMCELCPVILRLTVRELLLMNAMPWSSEWRCKRG